MTRFALGGMLIAVAGKTCDHPVGNNGDTGYESGLDLIDHLDVLDVESHRSTSCVIPQFQKFETSKGLFFQVCPGKPA
ncbi:MAG: hypothetical protein CMJ46_16380 [Planctomyces sp.]|nr:hypothetical protein [Planctomyces sp.]